MILSAATIFIRIARCIAIALLVCDARWMLSITACASKIPEDCSVCGIGIKNGSEEALGGLPPENTVSYPWMVSIGWDYQTHYCLGAMIDAFHILTAAHCVIDEEGRPQYHDKVHFRNEPHASKTNGGFDIDEIIPHPLYDLIHSKSTGVTIAKYDIALVRLKRRIKCDVNKNPICLPHADFKLNLGEKNIFTGWSFPHPVKGRTNLIRKAFIKNLNFSECIKGVPEAKAIEDYMLCQGDTAHRICYGDSGGPLIKKMNQKYYVVGIASSETNTNCALSKAMIFTDVIKFLNWIKEESKTVPKSQERSNDSPGERTNNPQTGDNIGKKRVLRWESRWIAFSAVWNVWHEK